MNEALEGGMEEAVLEWAARAALKNKVAPPSALVRLLPLAQKHGKRLGPVLGARGEWLADLQGITLREPGEEERAQRALDPGAYRERLAAEWDDRDWKQRAKAIAVMRAGLTLADEPLLDHALADPRKEVRDLACDLLMFLPDSKASHEVTALATSTLLLEKAPLHKSLTVRPPEPKALPKWLPKTTVHPSYGPKALALFDVIRFTPPARWNLSISPVQLLDLAEKTDYADALIEGLAESAIRFEDQSWIDTLFEFLFDRDFARDGWDQLSHRASEVIFERMVKPKLESQGEGPSPLGQTLVARKRPLSRSLSRAIVLAFRVHATQAWLLLQLAPYLHPESVDLVSSPYSDQPHAESVRERLCRILDTRKRLLDSLDN
ncbi:MAG TPA: DUF5691 domain-containing protein [Fimbriimonadaceae bacterium]|nr:DUF5691 domain-containing protein [Fimbriimonadaceae bacterium]